MATNTDWTNRKSALNFFVYFGPVFFISETSSQYSVERCAILCNIYRLKLLFKSFFTMWSDGAFKSLQKVTGTNSTLSSIWGYNIAKPIGVTATIRISYTNIVMKLLLEYFRNKILRGCYIDVRG